MLFCFLYIFLLFFIDFSVSKVVVVTRNGTDERKVLPANEMRRVFMDSMSVQLNETSRVRGLLNLVQHQLAEKKAKVTSKETKQNAQIMQWLRAKDIQRIAMGLEGADVINKPVSEFMFQSDMVLNTLQTKVLADVALQDLSETDHLESNKTVRTKRQAQTGPSFPQNQWNTNVPISYYFDSSIDQGTRRVIKKAIAYWQEHTCITFKENGNVSPKVRFFQGGGCYSQVGRSAGQAEQMISIGRGCEQFGIITHEIAHTLGFFHSQSRYDRDTFVKVVYSNLTPQMMNQFTKQTPSTNNNYGVDYDYGSVMHYADTDASKNVVTMLAKDKIYQHTMGNNVGPSFSDLLAMNIYYNCIKTCSEGILCKNGGFRKPNNCNECTCPSGFGGSDCSQLQKGQFGATEDCGQVLTATKEWSSLENRVTSPQPTLADRHSSCTWHIKAEPGQKVQMKVLDVFGACSVGCFHSGLELKIRKFTLTGSRVCCQSDADNLGYLESEGNLAVVIAYSAYKTRGFKLQFRAVGQPGPSAADGQCEDKQEDCARLQTLCSHARYYKLMTDRCPKSCGRCVQVTETAPAAQIRNLDPNPEHLEPPRPECGETDECVHWENNGFCKSEFYSEEIKKRNCGKTCKLC